MTDALAATAAAAVDHDHWTTDEHGQRISQTTNPAVIRRMLGMLDLAPGMRVLEIGAGSGYSGALLATAVGANGAVVSLDVDDALIQRAVRLHRTAGHANIEHHTIGRHAGQAPLARRLTGSWHRPRRISSRDRGPNKRRPAA